MAGLRFVSDDAALDAYSQVVTRVARRLAPSVANVRLRRGAGSAVAIAPDGFLLTSAHVVERAQSGAVSFADGSELRFSVAGRDPLSDLAVLRADSGGLAAAHLRPIEGSEQIARTYVDIASRAPNLTLLERTVNGQPGLVAQIDGVTVTVYAFDIMDDRIARIWAIRNPQKLRMWTTG